MYCIFPLFLDRQNDEFAIRRQRKVERDSKLLTEYCDELKVDIQRDARSFLRKFSEPVRNDPEEYLRNLRFYGLQKTDEGTEYTMMQDCSMF